MKILKKMFGCLAMIATLAVDVTGASAQTLAERDAIASDKTQLALYAKRVNDACASHIKFAVDYRSYRGKSPAAGVRRQAYSAYLMNAGDAIINICVTPAGKTAVAQKIRAVIGRYGPAESTTFANGVVTYSVGFEGGSVTAPETFLKTRL